MLYTFNFFEESVKLYKKYHIFRENVTVYFCNKFSFPLVLYLVSWAISRVNEWGFINFLLSWFLLTFVIHPNDEQTCASHRIFWPRVHSSGCYVLWFWYVYAINFSAKITNCYLLWLGIEVLLENWNLFHDNLHF